MARRPKCRSWSTSGPPGAPLPRARADPRAGGCGAGRAGRAREGGHGREPEAGGALRHPGHPGGEGVPRARWRGSSSGCSRRIFSGAGWPIWRRRPARQALAAAAALVAKKNRAGAEAACARCSAMPRSATPRPSRWRTFAGRRARRRRRGGARFRRSAQPAGRRRGRRRRRLTFARDAAAFGGRDAATAALARDPNDLEARFALASAHAAALEWEPALAELLELVRRNRKFRDDGARLAMLAIFDHLGPQHPLVSEYRRQLRSSPDGERIPPRVFVRGCRCRRCMRCAGLTKKLPLITMWRHAAGLRRHAARIRGRSPS